MFAYLAKWKCDINTTSEKYNIPNKEFGMHKQISTAVLSLALILTLSACGGGGGESTPSTETPVKDTSNTDNPTSEVPSNNSISFSGIAVDGYISGGTACLDKNINGRCDSSEPTTLTDANGQFTFTDIEVDSDVFMPVIVTGGIDTASNKPFEGSLSNIIKTDDIATNASFIVSPLTDLVATSFIALNDKSATALTQIKSNVASALNINKVDDDPMQDKEVFAKAQEVQQTKELIISAATKAAGGSLSEEELAKSIKEAMAASAQTGTTLSSTDVIEKLEETNADIDIPSNETDFIANQATEIIESLAKILTDATVTTDDLSNQQVKLETIVETASASIEEAIEGSTITVVVIDAPVCAQVISYATNPSTQKCEQFATPCDVPSEWVSCESASTPIATALPTPPAIPAL